ncbi:MAG: cytochrome c oxidase subunit 3 [Cyclobacteriaceae bacterium]|nr:cytochrome c oxidase subunit 3 [Cyclobacteriaceae bacterium]MCX7636500.1 cytochrome c oxidase subunit 3 [Cyclobacteriaceae bacterium]MDW8330532.1 cytochrome c oxidase subunit 3 [Cyclobacteriaceae bacterium]
MEIKELKIVEEAKKPLSMNPKKFALWLFMVSVMMLFGAWTSAYLVKRADAGWAEIVLPERFLINTIIIVASSISLIIAYRAAKKDNLSRVKTGLILTFVLGVAFVAGQILGYGDLIRLNEYFTGGAVSHSFIYVLTGVHGLHMISGIIFLGLVLADAFRYRIHSKNMLRLEMCSTYWHFLGGLWLYLFVFLKLYP